MHLDRAGGRRRIHRRLRPARRRRGHWLLRAANDRCVDAREVSERTGLQGLPPARALYSSRPTWEMSERLSMGRPALVHAPRPPLRILTSLNPSFLIFCAILALVASSGQVQYATIGRAGSSSSPAIPLSSSSGDSRTEFGIWSG